MRISDWMTKDVIYITPDTSMMKASRLMKDKGIRRLPVLDDDGRVVGIVSDRDVKEASPSKATTLDMHELYYLLSELKVKDIMTKKPVCLKPDDSVEEAALLMVEKHIGGMPVVDGNGRLAGIITDSDIFKVLLDITGVRVGGIQLAFELKNEPGTLRPILDALREHKASVVSVLTSQQDGGQNRMVFIRIRDMGELEGKMLEDMRGRFNLMYWHKNSPLAL